MAVNYIRYPQTGGFAIYYNKGTKIPHKLTDHDY